MLEYKVIEDSSMTGTNDPKVLEKKVNEMVREGWRLAHVAPFGVGMSVSRIYLFFERELLPPK